MHLRVAALLKVFGRAGRVDQGRIYDRARRDAYPFRLQGEVHRAQNFFSQVVLFQQVPECAHRDFVGHRLRSQINPGELSQGRRVLQRLFHGWVRQVEPLLQKLYPQHGVQFFRPSPIAWFRIVRLDQPAQLRPRYHLLHLFQKDRPPRLLRIALKSTHHCQCPLFARSVHAGTTLSILAVERELLIRVSLTLSPR